MTSRGTEAGFSLIELMIVVLIIAILISIAIPVFSSIRGYAQRRSCFANQRQVEGAARSYEASNGQLPAQDDSALTLRGALVPEFLVTAPACPSSIAKDFTVDYEWSHEGGGSLTCVAIGAGAPHGHF